MSEAETQDGVAAALDMVEARIRGQAAAAERFSMVWRAHMADVMHVEAIRGELGLRP